MVNRVERSSSNSPDNNCSSARHPSVNCQDLERSVGNHSYYDNSHVEGDYWGDVAASMRTYSLLPGINSAVRIYRAQSPSSISFKIRFNSTDGSELDSTNEYVLLSRGIDYFDSNLQELVRGRIPSATDATAHSVIAINYWQYPAETQSPVGVWIVEN